MQNKFYNLELEQHYLEMLLKDDSPVAITVLVGKDFKINYVNPAGCRMWKKPVEKLANLPFFLALPDLEGSELEKKLEKARVSPQVTKTLNGSGPIEKHLVLNFPFYNISLYPIPAENGIASGVMVVGTEITQEIRLPVRQKQIYELLMQTPAALGIVTGENHIFEFANTLYMQKMGGKTDLLGRPIREVFPELESHGFFEILDKVYNSGEPFAGNELPITWDDNGNGDLVTRYLNFVCQPFRGDDGQIQGIMTHVIDITEQVVARKKAEEAESQLHSLANNMPQLVWMAHADGYIYWYNSQWYMYTGTEPKDMEGWGWQSVHDPKELPRVLSTWRESIESGKNFEMIFPLKGADGVFRPFLTRIIPIKDSQGRITQWFGTNTEITKQISIENALKRSEAQFKALYESNVIGVLFCDFVGRILDANDAFLNLIGYTREELEKGEIRWREITPEKFREADNNVINKLKTIGVAEPREKEYINKDGTHIPVIVGGAVLNNNTTETISFVLDIREQKSLEQRKDEFIGVASHELKTPLASIKGYVQLIERIVQKSDDEKAKNYVAKTNIYINRLNSLIDDLLDVSKIQAGRLLMDETEFNFNEVLEEAVEPIQMMRSEPVIEVNNNTNLKVIGDKNRIEQVLTNLLSNAIKYAPKSDIVFVRIIEENGSIKVGVQDFGIGIPKNKQTKIFERFYRIDEHSKQFSGLGIGLYISAQIIERHGGKFWVESEEEKGSTFYFTLPISEPVEGTLNNGTIT